MSLSRHYDHASSAEQARLQTAPGLGTRVHAADQQRSKPLGYHTMYRERNNAKHVPVCSVQGAMGVTLCSAYI